MAARPGDMPRQPPGNAEHADRTDDEDEKDDPGEDVEAAHDDSTGRLRLGEFPLSAQYLRTRPIEPYRVVPALHDRNAVRNLAVAAAELDVDRPVGVLLGGDVVERIGIVGIFLVIAFGIIDADRPETVNGHILDVEPVDRGAVIFGRRDVKIGRILVWIAAPGRGGADQVPYRIHLIPGAERLLEIRYRRAQHQQRIAHLLLAGRIPIGYFELAGAPLADLDRVLKGMDLLHVLWVRRIDQGAHGSRHVSRADLVLGECVRPAIIGHRGYVVVLVDDHQRHETLAGVRHGDGDRPGVEVEHSR